MCTEHLTEARFIGLVTHFLEKIHSIYYTTKPIQKVIRQINM